MEIILVLIGTLAIGYYFGKSRSNSTRPGTQPTAVFKPAISPAKPTKLNTQQIDVSDIKLSEEQEKVFHSIEEGNANVYITGKAGTGKSMLLQYFVRNTRKSVAVVAPTGVAALNVGGQTIHSLFKLKPTLIEKGDVTRVDSKTKEVLANLDSLVIDEISMVRVDLMEAISEKLKLARRNELPFGGVQVILFGDLFQLPPVVSDGQLRRYFDHTYGGVYFFNAPSFQESECMIIELEHIFRQRDAEFKRLLSAIRNGSHSQEIIDAFNQRAHKALPESGCITLAGTNAAVSRINQQRLNELVGEEKAYEASVVGDLKESSYPTEKNLKLKVGAQVMLLKNDRQHPARWVNGTLGIVTKLSQDVIKVKINGVEHTVSRETWNSIKYYYDHEARKLDKEIVSSFIQFPLRLAWAVTIHKSQGQTYQSVAIDLTDGAFAHGQTYVALSRCVSLDGLYLTSPIRSEDIIVDQDVIEYMNTQRKNL